MLQRFLIFTLTVALVYAAVQHNFRSSANDPQIQMAEDLAWELESGKGAADLSLPAPIDMARSLATFVIIYDENGMPLVSSAELQGQTPIPPAGVFAFTRNNVEDRLTWEPSTSVRSATVIRHVPGNKGFVLVGRSLREVEDRENILMIQTGLAWILGVAMMLFFRLIRWEKFWVRRESRFTRWMRKVFKS